ncbi:MAG: hypothetical protein Q9170_006443 [Blastenia crenularia]
MREGWVRSINARSTPGKGDALRGKREGLEESVVDFKGIFGGGRKGLGKGKVLLLNRGPGGELGVWAEDEVPEQAEKKGERGEMKYLGGLQDERISRLVWLGYLGGGNVASEEARKSVVEGVMEIVERPIGTIDTQVVELVEVKEAKIRPAQIRESTHSKNFSRRPLREYRIRKLLVLSQHLRFQEADVDRSNMIDSYTGCGSWSMVVEVHRYLGMETG